MNVEPNFQGLHDLLAPLTDQALRLDYNNHKSSYSDFKEELSFNSRFYDYAIWVSATARDEAIAKDEIWELCLDKKKDSDFKKYIAPTHTALIGHFTDDAGILAAIDKIHALFKELLTGKYSSAHLEFNGQLGNYESLQEAIELKDDCIDREDWVSDAEYEKALATNTMWSLQWYPRTPIGFIKIQASSLEALVNHFQ
jgi:hypothetical protein